MMGSWEGRGNQYIRLVKVLYCKLLTNGKQLPPFSLEVRPGTETLISEVGGESVTTLPLWPLCSANNLMLKIFHMNQSKVAAGPVFPKGLRLS